MIKFLPARFVNKSIVTRFSALIILLLSNTIISGQKVNTTLIEEWSNPTWISSVLQTNTYDASEYLINTLNQTYDVPSSTWIDVSNSVYSNNPDGTASQELIQIWDEDLAGWVDAQRITYTYNGSGKILTSTTEMYFGLWMNSLKVTNTYDGSGFLVNKLSQSWDFLASSWVNAAQEIYTNNLNGSPTTTLKQTWNSLGLSWNDSQKETTTYYSSDKVLTSLTESITMGVLLNESLETNTYDVSGYMINSLSQMWDVPTTAWVNETQSNITNNVDGSISQVVDQEWSLVDTQWKNFQRITFSYSVPTVTDNSVFDDSFVLYPNPSRDFVKLRTVQANSGIYSFNISDLSGRIVLKGKILTGSASIDISGLSKGLYFLKLESLPQRTFKFIRE